MECQKIQEFILVGQIDRQHLASCKECKAFLHSLEGVTRMEPIQLKSKLSWAEVCVRAESEKIIKFKKRKIINYLMPVAAAVFLTIYVGQLQPDRVNSGMVFLSKSISGEIEGLSQIINDLEDDLLNSDELISREMRDLSKQLDSFLV